MLCVIGGLLLLIGGCVATCTVVVARKAKAYGADASQHPELTALSLAAAVHPGIEVVSKDKAADTEEAVLDKAHAVQHATIDDGRAKVTIPVAAIVVVGTAALVWIVWRRRR